jgi:hypothetical protein
MSQASLGMNQDPISEISNAKKHGRMTQVVEHLLSKYKFKPQ